MACVDTIFPNLLTSTVDVCHALFRLAEKTLYADSALYVHKICLCDIKPASLGRDCKDYRLRYKILGKRKDRRCWHELQIDGERATERFKEALIHCVYLFGKAHPPLTVSRMPFKEPRYLAKLPKYKSDMLNSRNRYETCCRFPFFCFLTDPIIEMFRNTMRCPVHYLNH